LLIKEDRDAFDLDFQHQLSSRGRHSLLWGAGYRTTSDRTRGTATLSFNPAARTYPLYSVFAEDDIGFLAKRLIWTVGTKLEHNDFSGFEVEPSIRLAYRPRDTEVIWGAISRAVRMPTRRDSDLHPLQAGPITLIGNPHFESETALAYEFGYRVRPASRLYVTFASFFNVLDDTLSTELGTAFVEASPPPARLILPVSFRNGLHGNSAGVETTVDARLAPWWRLIGNYSYLNVSMTPNPGSRDVSQERRYEGLLAHHQWEIGSSWDVRDGWMVDGTVRYVSAIQGGPIPRYVTANLRVARQIRRQVELAVVGQNLFDNHHAEWPSGSGANVEVQRSVSARLTWQR